MLKLYKKDGDTLRYWEAWVHEDKLTVHWGVVGEQGEEKHLPLPADEDPDMALAQAAEPLVDQGYDEPEPGDRGGHHPAQGVQHPHPVPPAGADRHGQRGPA